jgi:hypothetical protein
MKRIINEVWDWFIETYGVGEGAKKQPKLKIHRKKNPFSLLFTEWRESERVLRLWQRRGKNANVFIRNKII